MSELYTFQNARNNDKNYYRFSYIKEYIHPNNEPPYSDNHALIARNKSSGKHRNGTTTALKQYDAVFFKFTTGNSLVQTTQVLLLR